MSYTLCLTRVPNSLNEGSRKGKEELWLRSKESATVPHGGVYNE